MAPERFPFGRDPESISGPLDWLPVWCVAPVLVVAGILGAAAAVAGLAGRFPLPVAAFGTAYALVFGILAPGMQPIMFAGYLVAVLGPVVLFGTVVAGAWRWRGGPAVVGLFVLVVVVAWLTGFVNGDILVRYGQDLAGVVPKLQQPMYQAFLLAGGIGWAVVAGRILLGASAGRPAPAWTRPAAAARWGRVATCVAVVCALPYGLLRMTWLTPWPFGFTAQELAATPEIRLHGLLLGLAALGGAVLTCGLVARWGEVWPRWMPVVRGRPVPVAAAVVPGALVATLFCCAAIPFTASVIASGQAGMAWVFPFPIWGPALAVAVLGYALRRRATTP